MEQFSGKAIDGLLARAIEEMRQRLAEKVGEKAANEVFEEAWRRFGEKPEEVLSLLTEFYGCD